MSEMVNYEYDKYKWKTKWNSAKRKLRISVTAATDKSKELFLFFTEFNM